MDFLAVIRLRSGISVATLLSFVLFMLLPPLAARAAVTIQDVRSDKGIQAWLVEDYTVPIVTIRFVFDGGATQDPPGKEGLASLMTGLFDEGAGDLDSEAFQNRLDEVGAEMRFEESRDGIYGSMRMLADHSQEAFDLLRLAVGAPRFDQGPVDRIRGQILAGLVNDERDPNTLAQIAWRKALYGDHPYSRPEQGTIDSIATITVQDLRTAHDRLFARDGLHVAVVGAIDAQTLKRQLDLVFGDLPQKQELQPVADIAPRMGQRLHIDYDLPQTSLQLAFPGVKRAAPDFYAAAVMNQILGGGVFTSRLYREVREKRGLAYGAVSSLVDYDHASALIITTATRSDRASETLALIREVVRQMAVDGPTEQELAAAKEYLIGAYAINNLNSSGSIAATLVQLQLSGLGIDYIERRASLIGAVTLDEVRAAAKKLLSAEPTVMAIGLPLDGGGKERAPARPDAALPGQEGMQSGATGGGADER